MDNAIFKKMKFKDDMIASALFAPPEYPKHDEFISKTKGKSQNKYDFVHLFITSKTELAERLESAANTVAENGMFWLSYPKSVKAQKYDVNRSIIWDYVIPFGWHPVAQVSLSDTWSAMRLKRNEPGTTYERPGKKQQNSSEKSTP